MLTVSRSERDLLDSIRSGARGFLSKDLSPDALVSAVRDIRNGILPMSRADASLLILRLSAAAPLHRPIGVATLPELTSRENEVLALLADGLTDREISVSLVIIGAPSSRTSGISSRSSLWRTASRPLGCIATGAPPPVR